MLRGITVREIGMPTRPFTREQTWLLPPTLEELIAATHPARFVAAFVDELDRATWEELGVGLTDQERGAPAYDPRVLLSVWLYGFMTGVRSSRKLEAACREQLPYLWLTGWQQPDHNTLWRFYHGHRRSMRHLLRRTVRIAVQAGLVDLAMQAVDGTRVAGNAARERSFDATGLNRLLAQTEAAIAELEAQNATAGEAAPPLLPPELARAQALQARVQAALVQVQTAEGHRVNLTDPDAVLIRSRQGGGAGYNAQAVVAPMATPSGEGAGSLITAADVVASASDQGQLLPMVAQADVLTGQAAQVAVADGGYHSGPTVAACAARGTTVLRPDTQRRALTNPFHKDNFIYQPETDTFTCPHGQLLRFNRIKRRRGEEPVREYRTRGTVCRRCPAFGHCTTNWRRGRTLEITAYEAPLRQHRTLMATPQARAQYRRRQGLIEPVFGILKEQQGLRRFWLRGLANVRAEWALLATAFNLRMLRRCWIQRGGKPLGFAGARV